MIRLLGYSGLAFLLVACGSREKGDDDGEGGTENSENVEETHEGDIARLEALSPGELARKIYDSFGPEMTLIKQGQGQADVDYLDANASNFIGSISNDPNNQFASSFSIGYFLALAGLSTVVGDNYAVKVYSGRVVHDCREMDGAVALLMASAPTMTPEEAGIIAADLVQVCQIDPAMAAKAIVQSYSFALKATL